MNPFWLGLVSGTSCGAVLTALGFTLYGRLVCRFDVSLTDADREAIAQQFSTHTAAVRQHVSEFADSLAGTDVLLRERLRLFQRGEGG